MVKTSPTRATGAVVTAPRSIPEPSSSAWRPGSARTRKITAAGAPIRREALTATRPPPPRPVASRIRQYRLRRLAFLIAGAPWQDPQAETDRPDLHLITDRLPADSGDGSGHLESQRGWLITGSYRPSSKCARHSGVHRGS